MPLVDFFNFFRYALAIVVTIYATVVTLQSLWTWYVFLSGANKHIALLRRYILVQALRLRFRTFYGDVLICLLLCVVFLLLWRAHFVIDDIGRDLQNGTTPSHARHV